MTDAISAMNLRTRTLIFLILLMISSGIGVVLLWNSQDKLNRASHVIQKILLPAGRLIERARTEIDLQIQELTILAHEGEPGPQDLARLRLTPGVKSLLELQTSALFPAILNPLFKPWSEFARGYETQIPQMKKATDAIVPLKDLRQKTVLLHRAVDRELSVQLLRVTQGGGDHILWGASGLLLSLIFSVSFIFLVRAWMNPLVNLRQWTEDYAQNPRTDLSTALPPQSVLGRGLLSPPAEVQSLIESFRTLVQKIQGEREEVILRAEKTAENERALITLFSAFHHVMRHNEELLRELIKSEKLASMGEMAAQLAHEIRNPLNSLSLKLELLREELKPELQTQLDKVLGEIDRLDALTESHLRTTRSLLKGDEALLLSDHGSKIDDVVDAVIDTLKPELSKRGIFVQKMIGETNIRTSVPTNVLKAALLNFMKNAAEALESAQDRVIRIQYGKQGDTWRLAVADTGCGMPAEFLNKPIESFRTTKDEGSGLGLVTSQKMTAPYGVNIEVRSPAGSFATEVALTGPVSDMKIKESGRANSLESHDTNSEGNA